MRELSRRTFLEGSLATTALVGGSLSGALQVVSSSLGTGPSKPRFGVNYVPRKNWLYSWQDWDAQSMAEDLAAIAGLGVDHIRAHCLWPFFQPGINYVSGTMVDRLRTLLDLADRAGLDVEVTVLSGWMSGISFLPAWVKPLEAKRNLFVDPEVIEAEELLFTKIAASIAKHPRFLGFDLANEASVVMDASNPATPQEADSWATRLFWHCEHVAPGKLHVLGLDHQPWFCDLGFTRSMLANTGSITAIHTYPLFSGALKNYGFDGVGNDHLPEFMVEFAYAYQNDLSRKIWIEEVGIAGIVPEWSTLGAMPSYTERLVRSGLSTGKVWGVTWWGSHDISPSIKGFHPLEYTLGLLDTNNRIKPEGKAFRQLIASQKSNPLEIPARTTALVVPDKGLGKTAWAPDWTFARGFMKLVASGTRPAIVLESRSKDEDYLRARGIKELVSLAEAKK